MLFKAVARLSANLAADKSVSLASVPALHFILSLESLTFFLFKLLNRNPKQVERALRARLNSRERPRSTQRGGEIQVNSARETAVLRARWFDPISTKA